MNNYLLTKKGPIVRPPAAVQFPASISSGTAPIRSRLNQPALVFNIRLIRCARKQRRKLASDEHIWIVDFFMAGSYKNEQVCG